MKSDKKIGAVEMLRLYLRNRYSQETEEKVQTWLAKNPNREEIEQVSKEYWDSLKSEKDKTTFNALKRVNTKLNPHVERKEIVWLRTFSKFAAIFILLIGLSGVWYYLSHQKNPAMIEVFALYGETKQVILPDQTEVWLNAGSSLKYPSEFNQEIRSVSLKGEAFFSVRKDKSKSFVVETKNLMVKVLGTKFNLKAYPDEHQTIASLQEGKIEVQTKNKEHRQLIPNEQLIYNNHTSKLKLVEINPDDIPDWKNGNLLFSEVTLDEILQTLTRGFNISFDIDKSIDLSLEYYTIKFEHHENLEQILQVLADVTGDFSYYKKNGKIVLQKNII
ncbi:MAG: DUF4974 domain-containing protein [Bacteroidales bacterium]|nr:DUF4974 domain-containing protein [Bacteroidales bacterium]